jgi:hypothetical protein
VIWIDVELGQAVGGDGQGPNGEELVVGLIRIVL